MTLEGLVYIALGLMFVLPWPACGMGGSEGGPLVLW